MIDDKALIWPRMEDTWFGKPVVGKLFDPLPCRSVFLTASPERAPPEIDDMESEGCNGATVGRHCVVVEEPDDDLPEPLALIGGGIMHARTQLLLYLLQLRPYAVTAALPPDEELATA